MATVWYTCAEDGCGATCEADGNCVIYLYRIWQLCDLPVQKVATVWITCVEDGKRVAYLYRRWQMCG